jgi:heme a synthase
MPFDALLLLVLKAVVIAAIPLAYVWRARNPHKYRNLAWTTAFLTFDLVLFGAFTRLTDSGLGCPDWPGCYGQSNPLSAGESIRAAETAMPTGPVTMTKAWIEMLHRYLAMAVGFLIIVLTVVAWRRWRGGATAHRPWLAAAILAVICLQGAFGAWTVTWRLQPAVVTAHLLGGVGLLALLAWLALRESPQRVVDRQALRLRVHALLALLVLVAQIALGGWVSTNYAVLACADFPLCHGQVIPDMDFRAGFTLWRDLGMTGAGHPIAFQALTAIHWVHRLFALAAFAAVGALAWRAWGLHGISGSARALAVLLVLQGLTGLSNILLEWPLAIALAHDAGAALLVVALVVMLFRTSGVRRDFGVA